MMQRSLFREKKKQEAGFPKQPDASSRVRHQFHLIPITQVIAIHDDRPITIEEYGFVVTHSKASRVRFDDLSGKAP